MAQADPRRFDLIRGGYARHGARWVWWTPAGRELGNFFGLGGAGDHCRSSMLALTSARPRPADRASRSIGRFHGNGGFPPFFGADSGYVARRYVARRAHVPQIMAFSGVRRLIANLTTLARERGRLASSEAAWGRAAGGASPFSIDARTSHPPRVRRGTDLKNLETEASSAEGSSTAPIGCGIPFWQMGSGVRVTARGRNLALKGVESSRTEVGEGYRGAPLDVGTPGTLCLALAGVNAMWRCP